MRETLFRGNDSDTGRWHFGYYIALDDTTYCFVEDYNRHPNNTKHYIVFDQMTDWGLPNRHMQAPVDPATVCEFSGLTDKNKSRIFEGDIVQYANEFGANIRALVCLGEYNQDGSAGEYNPTRCLGWYVSVLDFDLPDWADEDDNDVFCPRYQREQNLLEIADKCEIIGSIHDWSQVSDRPRSYKDKKEVSCQ